MPGIYRFIVPLLFLLIVASACNNNGSGTKPDTDPIPPDPQDWVCPDSVVNLTPSLPERT